MECNKQKVTILNGIVDGLRRKSAWAVFSGIQGATRKDLTNNLLDEFG